MVLKTLNDIMSHGVEIQLKILQTILPLLTNYDVHGESLAEVRFWNKQDQWLCVMSTIQTDTNISDNAHRSSLGAPPLLPPARFQSRFRKQHRGCNAATAGDLHF